MPPNRGTAEFESLSHTHKNEKCWIDKLTVECSDQDGEEAIDIGAERTVDILNGLGHVPRDETNAFCRVHKTWYEHREICIGIDHSECRDHQSFG